MILIINSLAFFNNLVLSLLLLFKKPVQKPNYLLAFIVLTPVFAILFNSLLYLDFIYKVPVFMHLSMALNFLWAPCFYFYVQMMMGRKFKISWIIIVHLLPFIISIGFSIWFTTLPYAEQISFFKTIRKTSNLPMIYMNNLMIFQIYTYLIICLVQIFNFNKKIKDSFSDIQRISADWLMEFIFICIGLSLLAFIPILINPKLTIFLTYLPIASSLSYIFIVYKAITRPLIFSLETKQIISEFHESEHTTEKNSASLPENIILENATKLEAYLQDSEIFTNPELNIKALADKVQIPAYILSQTINRKYHKNFFEFINMYRIEEVKKRLQNPSYAHYTIDAIGLGCGFGSRTSFYNTFKKVTHKTPMDFKNSTRGIS